MVQATTSRCLSPTECVEVAAAALSDMLDDPHHRSEMQLRADADAERVHDFNGPLWWRSISEWLQEGGDQSPALIDGKRSCMLACGCLVGFAFGASMTLWLIVRGFSAYEIPDLLVPIVLFSAVAFGLLYLMVCTVWQAWHLRPCRRRKRAERVDQPQDSPPQM